MKEGGKWQRDKWKGENRKEGREERKMENIQIGEIISFVYFVFSHLPSTV